MPLFTLASLLLAALLSGSTGNRALAQPPAEASSAQLAPQLAQDPPSDRSPPPRGRELLPTHPNLVTGTLPNGLTYLVMKHGSPPGWATMWLHVHAGSLNETDTQRGLAHYLEHMAFNGSKNFPAGSVVPFFQSLGLTFGRDQNAFTNYNQTTYQLSMSNCQPETITKAMTFLSDVAFRLDLSPQEIENERKIILEERRRGLSGERRINDLLLERLAPESLLGKRATIGTQESIENVLRPEFVDFYSRWYVSSNMTVIVLADTDPKLIIDQITASFGEGRTVERPPAPDAGTKPTQGVRAIVATDLEVREATVGLARVLPLRPPATTQRQWRDQLVDRLAVQAFNLRLQTKIKLGEMQSLRTQARVGTLGQALRQIEVSATPKPGDWKLALADLTKEIQRARLHGLLPREIADVKEQALHTAESSAATEQNRPGPLAIRAINEAVTSGEPFMSAAQELELGKGMLPTITDEEVSQRLVDLLDFSSVVFTLTGPPSLGAVTEQELVTVASEMMGVTPSVEEVRERASSLLTELPKPGTIGDLTQHVGSSVWSGWLSNNVRVHHRFMNFRHNQVTITISLAGGELLETSATRGLARAAAVGWASPATSTLDSVQIRDLMNARNVAFIGQASADALTLRISGMPDQIEPGLQLAHLMLTDPKIEPTSFEQWKTRQAIAIERRENDAAGVFSLVLPDTVYPAGEPRPRGITKPQLDALTLAAAQEFLTKLIATSPIEVSIVGEIEKEPALDLVKLYLGSLSSRDRIASTTLADARRIAPPTVSKTASVEYATSTPKAQVLAGFFGPDAINRLDSLAMDMASRVLASRMTAEIREKRQLVYSIRPRSAPGETYPGYGMFFAAAPTDPAKADELAVALDEMYAAFAKSGPTEEELVVARKQVATDVSRELQEPAFWSQRLQGLTFRGTTLDQLMATPDDLQKLSGEEIRTVFSKYYGQDRKVRVVIKPKAQAKVEPAPNAKD
mgnify:CR=1 FL=1